MTLHLLNGNCLDVLPTLPAESVQCVVCSPPYYGLRDYGTASWDGGDPACDHTGVARRCDKPGRNDKQSTSRGTSSDKPSTTCLNCGARRVDQQIGLEQSPQEYVDRLVAVFREVRRVLRKDGTCWLNLGDSYAGGGGYAPNAPSNIAGSKSGKQGGEQGSRPKGIKPNGAIKTKDLLMIPARVALALHADGWWLRSEIIWSKAAPMPESVRDRPTCAHEKVFLLTKAERYFYDADAVAESASENKPWSSASSGGEKIAFRGDRGTLGTAANGIRNLRNVWHLNPEPSPIAHYAMMPTKLALTCIKAGSRVGDTVLDPFAGTGTTLLVADRLQRHGIGIELNPESIGHARVRLSGDAPLFAEVA